MSGGSPEPAEIVVGFVVRNGEILVGPRQGDPLLAGTWELPGGKVSPGEGHAAALAREVREETGLEVEVEDAVCALCHDYGDRRVALHAYLCAPASGASRPGWRWVALDEYRTTPIPAANPPLLDALAWLRSQPSAERAACGG